jgi:hypothetical protein
MDLSKFSTEDLEALQAGDLSRVSTEALEMLQGKKPKATFGDALKREVMSSLPVATVRGLKDIVDTGAEFVSRLGGRDEQARVRAMNEAGKAEFAQATEGRIAPQIARIGGNVLGTLPVVSGIGSLVSMAAPRLGAAISSGGMTTGAAPTGALARLGDMGIRVAGGAAGGGVAAGMVNPEDAGTGAAIGAVAPPALVALGRAGQAVGSTLRGPAQAPQLAQAVANARQAGYVIPPSQARPTLGNRLMEGFAGKLTTAQNASARNQAVTNRLAAEALGLPGDAQITPVVLKTVRDQAGQAYQAIGQTGAVQPTAAYTKALDAIAAPFQKAAAAFPNAKPSPVLQLVDELRSPSFDAAAAIEKVKMLRTQADDSFRTGNTDLARASRAASQALEDALETHLQNIGQRQLLQEFRDARQLIAKTYTVEKALNPASGSIDARKLAADLKRGKPLTGELKQAGDFAGQFPKASQPLEGMGSLPQSSPLDWHALGATSLATGSPLPMLGVGARPAARAAVLSPMVQNRLVQPPPSNALAALLDPEIQRLVLRSAPLAGTDR